MNLTDNYRLTSCKQVKKIPTGLDALMSRMVGKFKGRRGVLRGLLKDARSIDLWSRSFTQLDDASLKKRMADMQAELKRPFDKSALLKSFALVQEAVSRTLGYRPYIEQLTGALALYRGYVAEMSTGEGKTVTAAMCAAVRGWSKRPCHVITANDYLAARDAEIMKPLYSYCGVSVGAVTGAMKPAERREGYSADVTYSTAKEVLADFLRDRIAMGNFQDFGKRLVSATTVNMERLKSNLVQRGLYTAIVDEADNVLIDEAVTPLIISREKKNDEFNEACLLAYKVSEKLKRRTDYEVDYKNRTIRFLVDMESRLDDIGEEISFARAGFLKDLVRQALVARELFECGRHYVVEEGKVVIVDESTGRKMPMRSWNGGLHQMIEIKEGLEMSGLKETEARMSFQRFFRLYRNFSGMTGTGKEASAEFWTIYGAAVVCIPNHRKSKRKVSHLKTFASKDAKRRAIVKEVIRMHEKGRPILIGTKDIDESEYLASAIESKGLHCRIINAVRCEEEAAIVAEAGKFGAITVATNMAGRGTDIKIPDKVKKIGGLHVIATECNPSSRIDRQLFGRSARQGDPGSVSHYASFEDDVLRRNLPNALAVAFRHLGPFSALSVRWAQHRAGRKAYQSRLSVQRTDTWLEDSLGFSGN